MRGLAPRRTPVSGRSMVQQLRKCKFIMLGDTGAERRWLRLDRGEPRGLKNLVPVPGIIFRAASVPVHVPGGDVMQSPGVVPCTVPG